MPINPPWGSSSVRRYHLHLCCSAAFLRTRKGYRREPLPFSSTVAGSNGDTSSPQELRVRRRLGSGDMYVAIAFSVDVRMVLLLLLSLLDTMFLSDECVLMVDEDPRASSSSVLLLSSTSENHQANMKLNFTSFLACIYSHIFPQKISRTRFRMNQMSSMPAFPFCLTINRYTIRCLQK